MDSETTSTTSTTGRRTIRAVVHYRLTEAGRREAILRGLPAAEHQQVEADVDTETYLPVASVDSSGNVTLDLKPNPEGHRGGPALDAPTTWAAFGQGHLDALLAAARQRREYEESIPVVSAAFLADQTARADGQRHERGTWRAVWRGVALDDEATTEATRRVRADQEALEDARIAAFLADPSARAQIWHEDIVLGVKAAVELERGTNGYVALVRSAHPRWQEIREEVQRRDRLDEEAVLAVSRSRRLAKLTYLRAWVRNHGADDMRERQAVRVSTDGLSEQERERVEHLGLVPEAEVLHSIREATFAQLSGAQVYQRISAAALDYDDDNSPEDAYSHDAGDADCESEDETEATPAQWAQLKAIRALAPAGAAIVLRRHVCECTASACGRTHSVIRHGILVTVTVTEGLDLHREYAC